MTTFEERIRAEMDATMLEHEASENRRKIVKSVAHSSAMEGMPLSDEMKGMLYDVADGKMTTEDVKARLDAKYRR